MSKAVVVFFSFVTIIWLFQYIYFTECMKVIPERTNITYLNPKYITWANFSVKRYGRKSDYYFDLNGGTKQTWTNNVTIDLIFYEFLHNEYKRTFVEMHFKLCDMLNKDPYIGKIFASRGITCPLLAKNYFFSNITIPTQDFPHVWPFEKSRVYIYLAVTETKEIMGEAYCDVLFKVVKKRKTNK